MQSWNKLGYHPNVTVFNGPQPMTTIMLLPGVLGTAFSYPELDIPISVVMYSSVIVRSEFEVASAEVVETVFLVWSRPKNEGYLLLER